MGTSTHMLSLPKSIAVPRAWQEASTWEVVEMPIDEWPTFEPAGATDLVGALMRATAIHQRNRCASLLFKDPQTSQRWIFHYPAVLDRLDAYL